MVFSFCVVFAQMPSATTNLEAKLDSMLMCKHKGIGAGAWARRPVAAVNSTAFL